MSTILMYILLLLGEGIIWAAFFLGIRGIEPENLFYLNLATASIAYLLMFIYAFDITKQVSKSSHSTAGVGASIIGVTLYTIITVLLIILSYVFSWSLPLAFTFNGAGLFILLTFLLYTRISTDNVRDSISKIEERKESLKTIVTLIDSLEVEVRCGVNNDKYSQMIDILRDNIKYITASDSISARNLESKLANEIRIMSQLAKNSDANSQESWNLSFRNSMELIQLRNKSI